MIIQSKGDVVILRGVLAENHWPALKSVVSLLLKRHPAGVIIDGSALTEVSDSGAQTFLDASEFIESHNARVVVAGLSEAIVQAMSRVPGIRSQLPRAATVEEARASLAVSGTEALPASQKGPVVLVPLIGSWRRSIEYAVAQAVRNKAEIHLLYVIEVPRDQPMGVPLPEQERQAERVLAEAELLLRNESVTVRKLSTRARLPVDGAAKYAAGANPRIVVVSYAKGEFELISRQQDIFGTLCRDTECEVAVISSADQAESEEQPSPSVLFPLIGSWQNAVDFVGTEASHKRIDVDLLYVIPVPRAMSLDASMPDEERKAAEIFGEVERMLKRYRLPVRRVLLRSRDAIEGIARHASATRPRATVVCYERPFLQQEFTRGTTVGALCREIPTDVVTLCPTEDAP